MSSSKTPNYHFADEDPYKGYELRVVKKRLSKW